VYFFRTTVGFLKDMSVLIKLLYHLIITFLALFASISVYSAFQGIWSYMSANVNSFVLFLDEAYNWIVEECQMTFYKISEKLDVVIDSITGLFDRLIDTFLMILKIILFELDGLQTNIERSFSEI
jgi:hypothetical protein